MLAPDVRFEGFAHADWTRLLELLRAPQGAGEQDEPRPTDAGVVAVLRDGGLVKLLHTHEGRIPLGSLVSAPALDPAELARRHGARWALLVDVQALEDAADQFGANAKPEDDFTDQWLAMASLLRAEALRGRIDLWPGRWLWRLPLPSAAVLERSLDLVCPPGKAVWIGSFADDDLYTCVALRRGARAIDWVLGPDELRPELGPLTGELDRDHDRLVQLVRERFGPLALGCSAQHETFVGVRADPASGAWARAVAAGNVIVRPVPTSLALGLRIDAGLAALEAARAAVAQLVMPSLPTPSPTTDPHGGATQRWGAALAAWLAELLRGGDGPSSTSTP